MTTTKFDHLTDEEFVRSLHDKRAQSPIIDDLCARLEQRIDDAPDDIDNEVCCPVCEAALKIADKDGKLNLEVSE